MIMNAPNATHRWKFFRIGGLDQAAFETAGDLKNLRDLDQKLWVALSCPTKGLETDEKTLALIDTDNDGRIRAPELINAVEWTLLHLRDGADAMRGSDILPLAAINDATPEGRAVLASAKQILTGVGKPGADSISLTDTADTAKIFAATRFNGDGIVPETSAGDPAVAAVVRDILACCGGEKDRGGAPGVNRAKLDQFFADLEAHAKWSEGGAAPGTMALGEGTARAAAAIQAIRPKADDFYLRCRLAAYDARAAVPLGRSEADYAALGAKALPAAGAEIAAFPLARINSEGVMPLDAGINPAWAEAVANLRRDAVAPVLGEGKAALSEAEWRDLNGRIAAYEAWQASKAGASVEKLGIARVRELLASDMKAVISSLIDQDAAVSGEFDAIANVERLVRYHRDLRVILNNFVNFFDFYSRDRIAVFQAGTLYLDNRSCELCIRVDNPGAHAALAIMSKAYIAYVDCRRPGGQTMTVAACFTQGDSDYLCVGRNGIFYDRKGQDWDATISKVVDNPISIGQAFWSPYKRLIRFVEAQVAKRAAAADAAAGSKLESAATTAGTAAAAGKPPEAKPKFEVGTIAALGVAVGGITAALGAMLQAFFGLGIWMPLGLLGLVLVISGPAMIIAWLKLRQRNLGPILEANGWAINGRVKINIPFGSALTEMPKLPPASQRMLADPYEDETAKKTRRRTILGLVLLLIAALGVTYWLGTWPFHHASPDPAPAVKKA